MRACGDRRSVSEDLTFLRRRAPTCSTTTDPEKKEFGEFSLKALPWWSSDRRRAWYIRAESEE